MRDKTTRVSGGHYAKKTGGALPLGWQGGSGGESRFIVRMKRPAPEGGFSCKFRTYVEGGVWCVCETTDFAVYQVGNPVCHAEVGTQGPRTHSLLLRERRDRRQGLFLGLQVLQDHFDGLVELLVGAGEPGW